MGDRKAGHSPARSSCSNPGRSCAPKSHRRRAPARPKVAAYASSLGLLTAQYLNQSRIPPLYKATMNQCSLLSLATAVPPHVIEQAEAKALAREAFGGKKA